MTGLLSVIIIGLFTFVPLLRATENFKIITPDGYALTGDFSPPQNGKITWIFLHGLDSSRQEFRQLSDELIRRGYGVLNYDARGHGESQIQNNQKRNWRNFPPPGPGSEWGKMITDLKLVIKKLRSDKTVNRIGIIGASLGANLGLNYAATDKKICASALLSPGLNYWGIEILDAWRKYGDRPLLIAASPRDNSSYETVKFLAIGKSQKKNLLVLFGKNSEHGQQMLHDDFLEKFLDWIEKVNKK